MAKSIVQTSPRPLENAFLKSEALLRLLGGLLGCQRRLNYVHRRVLGIYTGPKDLRGYLKCVCRHVLAASNGPNDGRRPPQTSLGMPKPCLDTSFRPSRPQASLPSTRSQVFLYLGGRQKVSSKQALERSKMRFFGLRPS